MSDQRERPILFSGEMVRAILDGDKTQTRRVVKLPKWIAERGGNLSEAWVDPGLGGGAYLKVPLHDDESAHRVRAPYGCIGDRLWVRETWQRLQFIRDCETGYVEDWKPVTRGTAGTWVYDAEPHGFNDGGNSVAERGFAWRPSIFMPRAASRITLEITDVRVERVQDISEADAKAEGVERAADPDDCTDADAILNAECGYFPPRSYVDGYRAVWDTLNAKRGYGWDVNPWVWVLSFGRVV